MPFINIKFSLIYFYELNHRFIFILFIIINYRYINLKECKR